MVHFRGDLRGRKALLLAGGDRDAALLVRAAARLHSVSHSNPSGIGMVAMKSASVRTLLEVFANAGIISSSELLLAVAGVTGGVSLRLVGRLGLRVRS